MHLMQLIFPSIHPKLHVQSVDTLCKKWLTIKKVAFFWTGPSCYPYWFDQIIYTLFYNKNELVAYFRWYTTLKNSDSIPYSIFFKIKLLMLIHKLSLNIKNSLSKTLISSLQRSFLFINVFVTVIEKERRNTRSIINAVKTEW